jgi:hypothetical protein
MAMTFVMAHPGVSSAINAETHGGKFCGNCGGKLVP